MYNFSLSLGYLKNNVPTLSDNPEFAGRNVGKQLRKTRNLGLKIAPQWPWRHLISRSFLDPTLSFESILGLDHMLAAQQFQLWMKTSQPEGQEPISHQLLTTKLPPSPAQTSEELKLICQWWRKTAPSFKKNEVTQSQYIKTKYYIGLRWVEVHIPIATN